ncbi:urea ABC transporter ATP-binding protein UrtD [Bacillus taeanensis]|uniref:Urea ABC transporter ATP-binding protein UrtD n=1 Tax=Bacillus taeanensis TaxID=273032 RepID=A0A366XTZ0_9BACI|nr:urea ABC transporter ATP-binding protein UrtD [Bacillus taeanensis]RBW69367.1 urea ABC transporter ATP-binding protein UrtD [Bacillus taeanensis]
MSNSKLILKSEDITVDFSGFKAIHNLTFELGTCELHFLIGPNGAGKTTLLDVICGKTKISSGKVLFKGKANISKLQEHEIVHKGISRKFQAPSIFYNLTVYENLMIAMKQKKTLWSIIKAVLTNDQKIRLEEMLSLINLTDVKDQKAGSLAHGQKQWLEIAMVLLQEPELILLDEPIAGMSKAERTKTGELIQKIAEERTVLIVEHDMDFVREYAEKVTVMHEGQLLCQGTMEEVQSNSRVKEVYLGREGDRDAKSSTA